MNCRDFSDIADTYLSDELLVETNHDFLRHLESCPDCRRELSMRREIRGRVASAVLNADESQIDSVFANKLKTGLRESSVSTQSIWEAWRFAVPVFAALLIAMSVGFIWLCFVIR